MEFKITFKHENNCYVFNKTEKIGLDYIDSIRQKTGIENLSIDLFPSKTKESYCYGYEIMITEDIAREYSLFKNCSNVNIVVPYEYLNKFFVLTEDIEQSKETGEVTAIKPYFAVIESAVISEWVEKGYPKEIKEVTK